MKNFIKFLYSAALVMLTAWLCSYFTQFGIYNWYAELDKPFAVPADSVFPVIWSLIYFLLFISWYQILITPSPLQNKAGSFFVSQLILQVIWTFLFFYEGMLGAAFGIIIFLDLVVWQMIRLFRQIRPFAAYLNYFYFLWLLYATFLNFIFLYTIGANIEF